MKTLFAPLLFTLVGLLRSRALLHLEILSLRQQLAMVTARDHKRLRTHLHERLFWVWVYRIRPGCLVILATLAVFQPDTLIRWHQRGFRLYWTWKSRRRRRTGRPATPPGIRGLIRQLSRENPLWGTPRVHGDNSSVSGQAICPQARPIHSPDRGNIIAFPHLGGLHYEYRRAASALSSTD